MSASAMCCFWVTLCSVDYERFAAAAVKTVNSTFETMDRDALEKAAEQANEYGHSFDREVAFLTVHSMLHLLGYDHEDDEESRLEMREKEEKALSALGLTR